MPQTRTWPALAVALGAALVAAAVAGAAPHAPSAALPGYRLETVWPAAAHGLGAPGNLAAGVDGRVWVLDGPAGEAVALAPDGTVSERRPVPTDALDLAPDAGGDLFLGRWTGNPPRGQKMANVGRYAPDGTARWVRQCDCATGTGVAASPGRVWLTEPTVDSMTWLGAVDGRIKGELEARPAANGFPADITAAPDGTVFGTDLIGGSVFAWSAPYLPNDFQTWSMLESSGPFRIGAGTQDDGAVVVAVLFSDGLVRAHRPDGTLLARFFVPGEPADLTVGAGASIYVLDDGTGEVRVYVPGPPPTSTPLPPDPPVGRGSCQIAGTRVVAPARIARCGEAEVRIELSANCPPGAVNGADVALVIDRSLSMIKNNQMGAARQAARRFLAGLDMRYHRAAIVAFSDGAVLSQTLTSDLTALNALLDEASPQKLIAEGSATDIHAAIRLAMDHLTVAGRPDALPVVILLSDGEPTRPVAPEPATAALVAAERARSRRAYIVTIGLGQFVDSLLLESIASSPADFYYSPTVVDLNRIYDTILRVIQGISLTDLVVEDTPARPFVRPTGRSGPPALLVNDTLTWTRPVLPREGLVFTHTLAAGTLGRGAIGPARVRYTDADGTRRTFRFAEPQLEVFAAAPTPGAPAVTATPDPAGPTAPPPIPPPPPAVECPSADTWSLALGVFPDVVGASRYACPGCNGTWDGGDHWSADVGSAGPATVVVRGADGAVLWVGDVAPALAGPARVFVRLCAPPPYRVSLERTPSGYVSCPNSPPVREVRPASFNLGRYADVSFALWPGCGVPPPPTPTALPSCP